MKVAKLVARPIWRSLRDGGLTAVACVGAVKFLPELSLLAQVGAVAGPTMVAYGYGGIDGTIVSFSKVLVEEDRLLLKIIPSRLLLLLTTEDGDMTTEQTEEVVQTMHDYVLDPVWLPKSRIIRWTWLRLVDQIISVDSLRLIPQHCHEELQRAHDEGRKVRGIAVAESVLLAQVSNNITVVRDNLKVRAAGLIVGVFLGAVGLDWAVEKAISRKQ